MTDIVEKLHSIRGVWTNEAADLIEQLRAENERQAKRIAELEAVAREVRDDLLMRAECNKRQNDGEVIVEVGIGVWLRLNSTLAAQQKEVG